MDSEELCDYSGHGDWRPSSVGELYVENSIENKIHFQNKSFMKINSSAPAVKDVSIVNTTKKSVIVSRENHNIMLNKDYLSLTFLIIVRIVTIF